MMRGRLARFQGAVDPQGGFPGENVTLPVSPAVVCAEQSLPRVGGVFQRRMVDPRLVLTVNLGLRYELFGVQHNSDPSLDSNFYWRRLQPFFEQIRNGSIQRAPDSSVGGLWEPVLQQFRATGGLCVGRAEATVVHSIRGG